MAGKLIKALALNNEFRVFVVDATEMIREAQARHNSWSTATAALGRTIAWANRSLEQSHRNYTDCSSTMCALFLPTNFSSNCSGESPWDINLEMRGSSFNLCSISPMLSSLASGRT